MRDQYQTCRTQALEHLCLKSVERLARDSGVAQLLAIACCILQVIPQKLDSASRTDPRQVNIQVTKGRNYGHFLTSSRDCHIQPSPSSLRDQWPKPERQIPSSILAITDTDDDRVPFIAAFGNYLDETAARAHLVLPDHHFLESWSDVTTRAGVTGIQQPVMSPVPSEAARSRAAARAVLSWGMMRRLTEHGHAQP